MAGDGSAPCFAVGAGYASYRGPATGDAAHRHAAFQVAIAIQGEVTMVGSSGVRRGVALVVPPMVRHRMLTGTELLTFFIEPQCAFADQLRERRGEGIAVAGELSGLREEEIRSARPSRVLDLRLVEAMDAVVAPGWSMLDVAAQVSLPPQRLRALARQQLGMSLPRWRVRVRLSRTAEALYEGHSLAAPDDPGRLRRPGAFDPLDARNVGPHARGRAAGAASSPAARAVDRDRAGDRGHDARRISLVR